LTANIPSKKQRHGDDQEQEEQELGDVEGDGFDAGEAEDCRRSGR